MSIQELLPKVDEEKAKRMFSEAGITGWNAWSFSRMNLIMGENGAGKSRFLRTVRDICVENRIPCVYMDFTQMKGNYGQVQRSETDNLTGTLLFHGGLNASLYHDLIPILEGGIEALSQQLMSFKPMSASMSVICERLEQINAFLDRHLGRKLDFDSDPKRCMLTCREQGRPAFPVEKALEEMSPGERCILYFALGILCVQGDESMLGNYIFLLDEPENHLHPRALRALIEDVKLEKTLPANCRLLIASHSIFLVPAFQFEEIIHIQNGAIGRPSGRLYGNLYQSLIGSDLPGESSLQTFMTSLDQWGFANYIAECLAAEPTVKNDVKEADPQFLKLKKMFWPVLQEQKKEDQPVHLLDYGGGSGRIAKCLELYLKNQDYSLDKKLTYDIYDVALQRDELPREPWMGKVYENESDIPKGTYDFIVLYNVLHEIDVTEWAATLSDIISMLSPTGVLIFGERNVLTRGERPFGKSGYLVLRLEELKSLFGAESVEEIFIDLQGSDPTSCYIIRPCLGAVMQENVRQAVNALSQRMNKKVQQYINHRVNSPNSREYAFYCQGKINAEHALVLLADQVRQQKRIERKRLGRLANPTLNYIINEYSGEEQISQIRKLASIGDEEGERCRNWLKMNGYSEMWE